MALISYQEFKKLGARLESPNSFISQCQQVKSLIFDWDGVFHGGKKDESGNSQFSEIDAMGINMLRFGYYLLNGIIPSTFIVTGEKNHTAFSFAKREHLDSVFFGIKNKVEVINYLKNNYQVAVAQSLFVFDDILDLSLAKQCLVRLMIRRTSNPLLLKLASDYNYVDYVTAHDADHHALRECSELVLEAIGFFDKTIQNRIAYSDEYSNYLSERNDKDTQFYKLSAGQIISQEVS